jgi:hypothetical protein
LRNQNKLISAQMHAAATELVNQQKKAFAEVNADSDRNSSILNRIAALIICLSVTVAAAVFVVFRKTAAGLVGTGGLTRRDFRVQ